MYMFETVRSIPALKNSDTDAQERETNTKRKQQNRREINARCRIEGRMYERHGKGQPVLHRKHAKWTSLWKKGPYL